MEFSVLTYNIRHCKGSDGSVDIDRVFTVIRDSSADIVLLQEVDRALPRSGFIDQANYFASRLGFDHGFYANFGLLKSGMGNAILSRYPIHSTWNSRLPSRGEPRGLLQSIIKLDGVDLNVFCTHWGLSPAQRRLQSKAVLDKVRSIGALAILGGDFNAIHTSEELTSLLAASKLQDSGPVSGLTYPADTPLVKIDYIFTSPGVQCIESKVLNTLASDHLPVLARFIL